ncbi:MAG: hypothetical protein R2883_06260 [Caldisericia bacterium]
MLKRDVGYKETGKLIRVWGLDVSGTCANPYQFISIDNNVWCFKNEGDQKSFCINPKSGELLEEFKTQLEEKYKPPYKNPFIKHKSEMFIDRGYSEERIIFQDGKFEEKLVIAKSEHSTESPDVLDNPEFNRFNNIRRLISYHGIGVGYDEERFFGFDIATGQKTWWIDRSDLSEDALIQIVDRNGVCISEGSVISCYRKPGN